MPTLRQVIELMDKQVFINIELKVPYDLDIRRKYNWKAAVKHLHMLLIEYNMREHCFVSSFRHEALRELELVGASELYKIHTIYLTNFYHTEPLPPKEELINMGSGLNIQYPHITKELVDYLHEHGKLVQVWIDAEVTVENV